jgi:hypothetical protein
MPKVQRSNIPPALMAHLLDRVIRREITTQDLHHFQNWLNRNPTVPDGPWYKRFAGFTVCGEGPITKTFLTASQTPVGTEVQ